MKILFLVAHPDDEAYGPYGTIIKFARDGHDVSVYSMCDGARPGNEGVSHARIDRFKINCEIAGVRWKVWANPDLTLEVKQVTEFVSTIINNSNFDVVYTHNISDINRDHRILAEAALVACRPKVGSSVKKLCYFEVPSSTDWSFNKLQPSFEPNEYVEIPEDVVSIKAGALGAYDTETYDFPDARSVEAMLTLGKYRGYQVGYEFAEAFQIVFQKL